VLAGRQMLQGRHKRQLHAFSLLVAEFRIGIVASWLIGVRLQPQGLIHELAEVVDVGPRQSELGRQKVSCVRKPSSVVPANRSRAASYNRWKARTPTWGPPTTRGNAKPLIEIVLREQGSVVECCSAQSPTVWAERNLSYWASASDSVYENFSFVLACEGGTWLVAVAHNTLVQV
jgi:hypothetical protein